jgi:hypothetical protein
MKKYILKTNDYKITNRKGDYDNSNYDGYKFNFHSIIIKILDDNIDTNSITKYETNKSYYNELIDLLIKDKIPIHYIIQPTNYNGKSASHIGIITKRINSSVIINDYTIKLNKILRNSNS